MKRPNFGILLIALAAVIALASGSLALRLGTFKEVQISEIDSSGFTILVKAHSGPYHEIVATLDEVENWAKQNQVSCAKTIGEFQDDPAKAEAPRLRSRVGCWVGEGRVQISTPLARNLELDFISPGRMLKATFDGSPAIGPWKVYPQIKAYLFDHQKPYVLPNFEIYTLTGNNKISTEYLFWFR